MICYINFIQQGGVIMSRLTGRKIIRLTAEEKKQIQKILKSKQPVLRIYKRARVLYLISSGYTQAQAALQAGVCKSTSIKICARYRRGSLEEALYDRPRPGQPKKFTDKQKQRAIAMICSDPPKGQSRWTTKMIVKELTRRKIARVSRYSVWLLMKNHKLKPWREKNVVYRQVDKRV